MSDYFFDGQIPNYTSGTKNVKIDPINNQIVISDSSIPKTLTINSQQLSNGTQSLLFTDIYTTVNKTPSITYPSTNSTTLNVNNQIVITDGTTTNTLSNVSWTGQIATKNEAINSTHYLNFSNVATDAIGFVQKNSSLSCNPSLGTITCTSLNGVASSALTSGAIATISDNTNTTCYIPFSKVTASLSSVLYVDDTTGPLSYNPSTSTLICSIVNPTTLTTTNLNATNLTSNIASSNFGINYLTYAIPATGTQTLTTSQLYTYCYGTPTANQIIVLPAGTVNGQWIALTNLATSSYSFTIQYPSLTNIYVVNNPSNTAGNTIKFIWVTALSKWISSI